MAMTKCKECKQEVSTKAKTCPHCGVKNPGTSPGELAIGFVGLAVIVGGIAMCSGGDDDSGNTQQASKPKKVATAQPAQKEQKPAAAKPMTEDVAIDGKASANETGHVVVTGTTNLPDDTKLNMWLFNPVTQFSASTKAKVKNGAFTGEPLGPSNGIQPGDYEIEISAPISSAQPKHVQPAFGEDGKNLTGPLISNSAWGGRIAEYSFDFKYGTDEAIQKANDKHLALVNSLKGDIEAMIATGRKMNPVRQSSDLADARKCMDMMREYHPEAKALKARVDKLNSAYMTMKIAAAEVYNCVSCAKSTAMVSCDSAEKDLKEQFATTE